MRWSVQEVNSVKHTLRAAAEIDLQTATGRVVRPEVQRYFMSVASNVGEVKGRVVATLFWKEDGSLREPDL